MRIDPPCHCPSLSSRCPAPRAAAVAVTCPPALREPATVHRLGEAQAAQVAPEAHRPTDMEPSGKWPWQLPPGSDDPPPPEPGVIFVAYPSPAALRTGNMLDLLA